MWKQGNTYIHLKSTCLILGKGTKEILGKKVNEKKKKKRNIPSITNKNDIDDESWLVVLSIFHIISTGFSQN